MNITAPLATLAAGLALAVLLPHHALADGGYKACRVGDRVTNREGVSGTVIDIQSEGIYCHVDLDDGKKRVYHIFWMLHAADRPLVDPLQVASVLPGRYPCHAGTPTQYTFADIIVKSASVYTDNKGVAGTYSYVPETQLITFKSGSFAGSYAKYLEGHRIGLATKPGNFFATVCGLVP